MRVRVGDIYDVIEPAALCRNVAYIYREFLDSIYKVLRGINDHITRGI